MDKQGFPEGKPERDREKLRAWWLEETRKCGLAGDVSVTYAPFRRDPPPEGTGKRLFDALVLQRTAVGAAHAYHAVLTGAPWPIETVVITTDTGMVTSVVYDAVLNRSLEGEVRVSTALGLFGTKLEVDGPGADRFRARKELLEKCKRALCFRYEPPLTGFHAATKTFELDSAFMRVVPQAPGAVVTIRRTVRDEPAFVGRKYSLGLDRVLELLRALDEGA